TRGWSAPTVAPTLSQYGGTVESGYQLTVAKPPGSPPAAILYYTLDGSDPRTTGAGISPTAIAVSGNATVLTIAEGTRVRKRVFNEAQTGTVNDWSPEVDATFLLETPFPLRITELHYNPAGLPGFADSQDLEFIELTNTGSQTISLDGVAITQFSNNGYT